MYLDLFDELRLNKKLVKLAGFEVAAYWAELQSILKQVVKKHTADEKGFFTLDRNYVERETTLTVTKQLKCDEKLMSLGVLIKDPEDPNRLAISVSNMVEVITDEDTSKLKKTSSVKADAKAAKIAGIKANMKKAILETDVELRAAYERWTDGMVESKGITKAAVQLFEETISKYTTDKVTRLRLIEIATANSWKDANWAIDRLRNSGNFRMQTTTKLPEQKICTGVSNDVF